MNTLLYFILTLEAIHVTLPIEQQGKDITGVYTVLPNYPADKVFCAGMMPAHGMVIRLYNDGTYLTSAKSRTCSDALIQFSYYEKGEWRMENQRCVLGNRYTISDSGIITEMETPEFNNICGQFNFDIGSNTIWSNDGIEHVRFSSGASLYEPSDSAVTGLIHNGKHIYKGVAEHVRLADSIESKLDNNERTKITISSLLPHTLSRLTDVTANGVSTPYLSLMADSAGRWYFRFRDWRRRMDEKGQRHPPYWYQGSLPPGLTEFILVDKQNMLFTFKTGAVVWVHCADEPQDSIPLLSSNDRIKILSDCFPQIDNIKVSSLKQKLGQSKGCDLISWSNRGFIMAGDVPPRDVSLYRAFLNTFVTTPTQAAYYLNTLKFTSQHDIDDTIKYSDERSCRFRKELNGESGLEKYDLYRMLFDDPELIAPH